jgi:D-alanine transaminase
LTEGVRVISAPDQRWRRCDVKSVALLANVLTKQSAAEAGAFEAWQVDDDGMVTEGTHSNAWIVDQDGNIVTRPESNAILSGITRRRLLALARDAGLSVVERAFSLEEAKGAREAFLTSTSSFVVPVVQIDDSIIANGQPGTVAERLLDLYLDFTAGA